MPKVIEKAMRRQTGSPKEKPKHLGLSRDLRLDLPKAIYLAKRLVMRWDLPRDSNLGFLKGIRLDWHSGMQKPRGLQKEIHSGFPMG